MHILNRLWTGIVAAVTGAALAVLVQIVGLMMIGLPIDFLMWILMAFAGIGFLFGLTFGSGSKKAADKDQK